LRRRPDGPRRYRYESDGADRFLPHYDEVWPGSSLGFGADGLGEPTLEQDGWKYSSAATAGDPNGDHWAWSATDRISQLTVLLYLNDNFEGGETVLYPGRHVSDEPADGSVSVCVRPVTGAMLCFGQSFKFNRAQAQQPARNGVTLDVEHGADALLHEGVPVAPSPARGRKYVLRSDICYTMPYRGSKQSKQ